MQVEQAGRQRRAEDPLERHLLGREQGDDGSPGRTAVAATSHADQAGADHDEVAPRHELGPQPVGVVTGAQDDDVRRPSCGSCGRVRARAPVASTTPSASSSRAVRGADAAPRLERRPPSRQPLRVEVLRGGVEPEVVGADPPRDNACQS